MVFRFPFKVLSSSYFSIHHTGEINPKEILLPSLFLCASELSSDSLQMSFLPQVFVGFLQKCAEGGVCGLPVCVRRW